MTIAAAKTKLQPFTVDHFVKWAGRLKLDNGERWVPEDFFLAFLEDVFAGVPQLWLLVAEANAKTTNLAGLALYHCEFTPRAFVPWAASARDQAEIGYRQAVVFAESMPPSRRPRLYHGYRRVTFKNGSRIQVFAAGAEHADGVIPTLPILDELHRHRSLGLYRTWAGKSIKRNAQLLTISTAGDPGGEFEETRERIRAQATETTSEGSFTRYAGPRVVMHEWAVRDGRIDDMEAVKAANPFSLITVDSLTRKRNDPTMTESHWRRFTCNIAAAVDHDPFLPAHLWNELGDGDEIPEGALVCIGADGSRTWDTTVVAWAHEASDRRVDVDCRIFSVVSGHPHHVLHSGGTIDFEDVEGFLLDRFDRYQVLETAYDPRYLDRSMEIVAMRLPSASVFPVEPFSKNMRDAIQTFYSLAAEGILRHQGDPMVSAQLANTKVDRDPRNQEIRRIGKMDPKAPIDAIPAMCLAVWRAVKAENYEVRVLMV